MEDTNFDDLVKRALNIILSTRVDEYVLQYLGVTMEELEAQAGWKDETRLHWVETVVFTMSDIQPDERNEWLSVCFDSFRAVAGRMASHLQLTAGQIMDRTQ